MFRLIVASAFLSLVSGGSVSAQSSLGFSGLDASLDGTGAGMEAHVTADVAITGYHGIQGQLSWVETDSGAVGRVAGHLYLAPQGDRKYGFYGLLADADGRSLTYGAVGLAGMIETGGGTLSGFGAIGRGGNGGLDFIYGGVGAARPLAGGWQMDGSLMAAEFDEAAFSAQLVEVRAGVSWRPGRGPMSLRAGVVADRLYGEDGAGWKARAELRLSWTFGRMGGTRPATRAFEVPDPVLPLIRRGLY